MTLRVTVPHTEDGVVWIVQQELLYQGAEIDPLLTERRARFSYAQGLRERWTGVRDLVVCEADVEPAAGSLAELRECPHDWCVFRIWTGQRFDTDTLGLVRFSRRLQRGAPNLMHYIAAPIDPRYWVRMGWTNIPRDCSPAVLNGVGSRTCLGPHAPPNAAAIFSEMRPTTADSMALDTRIAERIRMLDVEPHLHEPPPNHHHDYHGPQEVQRPWWDLPRDAVDWPPDE